MCQERLSAYQIGAVADGTGGGEGPYTLVDRERFAVAGHSLGGFAALGLGRMREDVSAVIALEAPFLCDIEEVDEAGGLRFDETPYPVPVLNVYSDASCDHLREWEQYAENARMLDVDSPAAANAHFEGIGHLALTDLSLTSPLRHPASRSATGYVKPRLTYRRSACALSS